ncbi:DEAD/DEAH box helicase family protein [Methylomicrobium sp. RS1]|uniref:DEAD/DEAH box helicase family protein n=1 Tax=Candidatus Methylomicrobium oryzae TaxID=2802053 RepID=UPI0019247D18|nr:DEAD/DEAH box helicase family protein [Methylomicrobium sp. RS1]MBL1263343.1 DEAD/DEAH box helicase family protein [Methylomicrobium sp. RS1]
MSQLELASALTTKTRQLCTGLEHGTADILDWVTPTTAALLHGWFGEEAYATRRLNFHPGQKQAILNTIAAHEIYAVADLKSLYQQAAPDVLLTSKRLAEVSQNKHRHPKYCLKMATGTGKTWVLQALLIWQLLNKNAALAEGVDDARFTRHFLIVAPGLIAYDRLLDAFCGKQAENGRDFATSDIVQYAELFVPENHREAVFNFMRGNVCDKTEIGRKTTGNGMIAIADWHLLQAAGAKQCDAYPETPGSPPDPQAAVNALLPVMPGKAAGNSLDVLDKRFARGDVLDFLARLPELMVFNDEAHHIHDLKRESETTEVEWQPSLMRITENKGHRFMQVDFSAAPYNAVGSGKNKRKVYFPHIIADFDLKTALRQGLVKSPVLDRRKEIGALPLEFKAERGEDGNPILSAGQRVMLRAGLQKLHQLEADFARLDPNRYPKMLVVCEDAAVSPLVANFFREEGLAEMDIIAIDSGRKAELGEQDWARVRERLFEVDRRAAPRILISVSMLREGFDVNNICVIVPLRSSPAPILLEQIVGRGLRLMWREHEFAGSKRENRERIASGREPNSLIDILAIIEHPAFQPFYAEWLQQGLAGTVGEEQHNASSVGDMTSVNLREGFKAFDFAMPFILREAETWQEHRGFDIGELPPFSALSLAQLKAMLGKSDAFVSQDLQNSALFGDYRLDGAVMKVTGYNDFLSRLTRRIAQALSRPLPKGSRIAVPLANPYLQVNTAELAGRLESYIRKRLFGRPFEPFDDENWRLLLLRPVVDHITQVIAPALLEAEQTHVGRDSEVHYRRLSELDQWPMRESRSLAVDKCIYPRLPYPARNGGLQKALIEWANLDGSVRAFCKISATRHDFAKLRYVREDGLFAFYSPDFLLRTDRAVYLVETQAQAQVSSPNVQRKLKAAAAWCDKINALPDEDRSHLTWHYALLDESLFYEWRNKGGRLAELCDFARLSAPVLHDSQSRLEVRMKYGGCPGGLWR